MSKVPAAVFVAFLIVMTACAEPQNSGLAKPNLASLERATPAEVIAFFTSASYKSLHRTDAEFINDLYSGVLGRAPDDNGYNGWIATLKRDATDPNAREKAIESFLDCPEYRGKHPGVVFERKDTTRLPANALFDKTGVFVNDASALPADRYIPLFKRAKIVWLSLQIDNGGNVREDNVAAVKRGWARAWRDAGFKVGFWGAPRGVIRHNDPSVIAESTVHVQEDAKLAVKLIVENQGEFYFADCEDGYQGYNQTDPAPVLNKVYVDAFEAAAKAAGIGKMPRTLSSMGRVALDMKPWIDAVWYAMPHDYCNSYSVYQPRNCVDFYVNDCGWPIGRLHPTIATFTSEGEKRTVTLEQYDVDLKARRTKGFSFYLPESYLGLNNDKAYDQLAKMGAE